MPRKKSDPQVVTDGWVVKAPNTQYNGVTCGLKFFNGEAFIPADYEGAAYMLGYLKDSGYTVTREDGSGFELGQAPNVRAVNLEDLLRTPAPIETGGQ